MPYRRIDDFLLSWKQNPHRMPLILQGARQVGKTYSLMKFGQKHYENTAYFNFETDPLLLSAFDDNIEPARLVPLLAHLSRQTIVREKTLIIFDEIQLCERALTSLKYFCEQEPAYHVAAAGSLLGVAVNRKQFSFPVGKVDIKTMYPLDMEEFLLAAGEEELAGSIRESFEKDQALPAVLHRSALEYYRHYLLCGGMPACVSAYLAERDPVLLRHIQTLILESYLHDMSKYNTQNEIKKTRLVYDTVTVQLSRKNTRFQYKLVKSGGRAAEFENALEWLGLSGIIHRIYRAEVPRKPLENYRDIDSFKTYVSDLGLLCAKKNLDSGDILYPTAELNDFKGGMTENYAALQLVFRGYTPCYWTSPRGAEVDFVIQREGNIIPVEVKSADNTKAKSLEVYIETYKPAYAVKLSTRNFGFSEGKKTVPLYAAFCL